jgi:ribose transport system permease protein
VTTTASIDSTTPSAGTEPPPGSSGERTGTGRQGRWDPLTLLERFGLLMLFAALVALFSLLRPDTFATTANWQTIATSQSVLAVAALALIVPLISGRFDVSVGAILGLCSIACTAAMSKHGFALVPAIAIALAIGALLGAVNGIIVAYLGVNSIIATLGTSTIMGGLVSAYTNGIPISSGLSTQLTDFSAKMVLGVPALFVVMLAFAVVVWFLLTQTPYGRNLAAIGSNLRAAVLTGVDVQRKVMWSFVLSGLLAGVAGVLQVGATGSGDPSVGGINFIVPALAAVFLGATTWHPGKYNVPGTILGLFFVGTAVSGLALLGVRPWVTDVFNGSAVVIAIIVSAQFRRRRTGASEVGT